MAFTQHVEACVGHARCIVIWCDTDEDILDPETGQVAHPAGTVLWHSHMHADYHADHRVNPDHPAVDHRNGGQPVQHTPECTDCASLRAQGIA